MRKLLHFLIFVFIFSLSSCVNDMNMDKVNKEIGFGTSLVIPVGHSRASIFDVFGMIENDGENPEWYADSAGNFVYLYLNTILNLPADTCKTFDLKTSEGAENNYSFRNDAVGWFADGTSLVGPISPHSNKPKITDEFDYGYNKTDDNGRVIQRLDEVRISGAKINIIVDLINVAIAGNNANNYIELIFKIPSISFEETIKIYQTDGVQKTATFDIGESTIQFPYDASTTDMTIEALFHTAGTAANTITFGTGSDIEVTLKQADINVLEAWGYFNRTERVTGDRIYAEIPVDLFGNSVIRDNRILFNNPQIVFEVASNIGVPLHFIVDSIKAVDAVGATVQALFDNNNPTKDVWTKVPIAYPKYYEFGQTKKDVVTFDREHGETNKLFTINPERFIYDFHVAIDSAQAESDLSDRPHKTHFLARPLKVDMDVKSYLRFWFDENTQYASLDTLKLDKDLGDMLKIGDFVIEPERVSVNIDFKNHLPVQVTADVKFVDEYFNTLVTRNGIKIECPDVYPTGHLDANNQLVEGMVISEKVFTRSIALDGEDAEKMLRTRNIVIEYYGTAQHPATERINVRGTDYLDAVVSLFVKGKISGELGK